MKPLIKTDNLFFEYRQGEDEPAILALNGLNLEIAPGSFTAIVGPNGSGKSTLAKNLNGLLLPTEGFCYVADQNTRDEDAVWRIRQMLGMVFQNPDNQLVSSVVEDDVAFGPENLGVPSEEIRRRVEAALRAVGMLEERKKAPHMLSGGQKQRVAIAGVLAMNPQCMVLDEPTAMLDPAGRAEVRTVIAEAHKRGMTIVLITHFMEEAAEAERVVVLHQGKVALDGAPADVFAQRETILQCGLEVPYAVQVADGLRARGVPVPQNAVTEQQLADWAAANPSYREEAVRYLQQRICAAQSSADGNEAGREPALTVSHVTHLYNENLPYETRALDDVSFTVEEGSLTAIIGHTGSGKSTLLQELNGLLKPKSGEICVHGLSITDSKTSAREVRRQVGLVFQYPEYQLFEETVAKDVAFGPRNLGLPEEEIDRRVREALEDVGLHYEDVAERSPFDLSGGQKRRVAIAGVLAMEPQILVLDEPTAGLDPETKQSILQLVRKLHEEKQMTVLLVSHNMGDVANLADRVLVLDHGRVALSGTPAQVFACEERMRELHLGLPPAEELLSRLKQQEPATPACEGGDR